MEWTRRLLALVFAGALSASTGCGGSAVVQSIRPSPSPTQIGYLTVGGVKRVYVEQRPPSPGPPKALPLVIAMHGYTVDTTWMETTSDFDDLASKDGFVVVYPQGVGDAFNAGRCCGHASIDDVAFIRALINRLVGEGHVDRTRVFATGMSNGAMMAQRLACDLADQVTAVASVSGSLVTDSCAPSRAISILEMHGLEDDLVPYKGGVVGGLTYFPATLSNMQHWATLDGCRTSPAGAQTGIITIYTWSACRDGSSVVLETIAGAGHTWFSPGEMVGEPDASATVWDFFSRAPSLP